MKSDIVKYCAICQAPFHPDRRVEKRRTVCDKTECQRQKKKQSQQDWLEKNPDYFKGRYPQLKSQILANKQKKGKSIQQPKSRIQDDLTLNNYNPLSLLKDFTSIQNDLNQKITTIKLYLKSSLKLVYKTL